MLSDAGITLFGHTITTMQLLLAGSGLLCVALLIALARGKRIALQRSVVTDEIAIQLDGSRRRWNSWLEKRRREESWKRDKGRM